MPKSRLNVQLFERRFGSLVFYIAAVFYCFDYQLLYGVTIGVDAECAARSLIILHLIEAILYRLDVVSGFFETVAEENRCIIGIHRPCVRRHTLKPDKPFIKFPHPGLRTLAII